LSITCERDYRERRDIPVDDKPQLLDALRETGLTTITIRSLASAKWPPQMACIEEIADKYVEFYIERLLSNL
jgi:hypothetical protein